MEQKRNIPDRQFNNVIQVVEKSDDENLRNKLQEKVAFEIEEEKFHIEVGVKNCSYQI